MNFSKAILLLVLLVLLPSCRFLQLNFAELKSAKEKKTLFDQLIDLAPGKKVPYPFAELLAYIGQYGETVAVLMPLGLSQLRQAGYPEPFQDPRRIVAFGAPELGNANTQRLYLDLFKQLGIPELMVGDFTIDSRLFLAYTQKTNQIEVMSLLPSGLEFDYQVVKNYRATSNPFVATAEKKLCRACHQQDAPLTQAGIGSSSNVTPMIAKLIAKHHPDGTLDGIPIIIEDNFQEYLMNKDRSEDNDSVQGVADLLALAMMKLMTTEDKFTHLHNQALTILNNNKFWHDGCVRPKDKLECRKLMVKKNFTWSFHWRDLIMHQQNRQETQATVEMKTIRRVPRRRSRWPNYIDNKAEVRQDFSLSAAGKRVVDNIKAVKLGDLDPHSIEKAEPGTYGLITTFLEAAGADVEFAMPLAVPPLSPEDLAIVQDEVERLFIHVHRKDLHLNTDADPTFKQDGSVNLLHGLANFPSPDHIDDVAKIFRQQTLLPANKHSQEVSLRSDIRASLNPIVRFDALNATLEHIPIEFKLPDDKTISVRIYIHETANKITTTCQKTAKARQCEFKNLAANTSQCPSCTSATVDFTLHTAQDRQIRPPVSLVTLKLDGKNFNFELLCRSDSYSEESNEPIHYICTQHDAWLIGEVFTQMLTDQNSPVYSDYFNPVAIIRYMLKYLGYTEP